MEINEGIGQVICRILRDKFDLLDEKKYYFTGIDPEAAIKSVEIILADPFLRSSIEIHLPRSVFGQMGIPEECLTNRSVGDYRNDELESGRKVMLLAYPHASEWDTCGLMKPFGEDELMNACGAWVEVFAPPHLDSTRRTWWIAALRGLRKSECSRLSEFTSYVDRTAVAIHKGALLPAALGSALPALGLPKRSDLFSINESKRGVASEWLSRFNEHRKNQCFLLKKDKSDTLLDNDAIKAAIKDYREDPDHDHGIANLFDEYLAADYGITDTSAKIAEIEWDILNPALFERVKPKKNLNLGNDTLGLFASVQHLPDLGDEDKAYLTQLAETGTKGEASTTDRAFFNRFYRELQANPSLFSRWEAFILEKSVEDNDFLRGLARCVRVLRPRISTKPWKLVLSARASQPKDLFPLNESTVTYFSTRYRGLSKILADSVEFRGTELLFQYPEKRQGWKQDRNIREKLKKAKSGKAACSLVFYASSSLDPTKRIKFTWTFNPASISSNLRGDILRVAGAPSAVVSTIVTRETSGRRSVPLNLEDMTGLQAAFAREAGSLVPASEKLAQRLTKDLLVAALEELLSTHQLSESQKDQILTAFAVFEEKYKKAITALLEKGVDTYSEALDSSTAFGEMLNTVSHPDITDSVKCALLPILLTISTVQVEGSGSVTSSAAIVPPWHPLRMLAIASKAIQFSELLKSLTQGDGTMSDANGDLLFEDTSEWLEHIFYPEVACALNNKQLELLSACEHYQDYSVHEPPVKNVLQQTPIDTDPGPAATQIATLVDSYIHLQPHERDNLSVVLFDCDSEALPNAVVNEIRGRSDDEDQDSMCQILLAHSDKEKLRAIYRTLSRSAEAEDGYSASESAKEFMARLRINIMIADQGATTAKEGQPYDIVFSEDTIARYAKVLWEPVKAIERPASEVKPSSWSRRKAMRAGSISSAVFLMSPIAPKQVWDYMDAIGHAFEPEKSRSTPAGHCLCPCRSLGVHEQRVGELLDRMHSLGNWVVNYDELLHRKLLENRGIRIIRYKQDKTQGKNLIISSKAKDSLLRNELKTLILSLVPDIESEAVNPLIDRLIQDANSISGNLVLRAIRRTENAKELLGLVLSKYLVSQELGPDRLFGWFLLDDYASWLGEDEKQIADILCLSPSFQTDGTPHLDIVVTEAKFIDSDLSKKKRESANQLKQSLARLETGLGDINSLDRGIWLARISDMVVDGIEVTALDSFDAQEWRSKVRDGQCQLRIRGYSHVFGYASVNASTEERKIKETENGFQEVFSKARTCSFLNSFWKKQAPDRNIPASQPDGIGEPSTPEPGFAPVIPPPALNGQVEDIPSSTISPNEVEVAESVCIPAEHESPVSEDTAPQSAIEALAQATFHSNVTNESRAEINRWISETVVACRKALTSYSMESELVGEAILTPNALILRFKGSDNLTPTSIEKRRLELLTTHSLKVLSIIPQRGTVAISIERSEREQIFTADVWKRWDPTTTDNGNAEIAVAVQEHDNALLFAQPHPQPHTLVAGETGSGKSVLLQNILLGIAVTNLPTQAEIVIIDPKVSAQFTPFRRLPHMRRPIANETEDALRILQELTAEMDRRNRILGAAECADIDEYIGAGHKDLHRIWLVYDEFADWFKQDKDFKEEAMPLLERLAMKSRSSGIYLILAALRPDNTIFTMTLRSNLGNRFVLKVADEGTSDVATGVKGLGAERLLGKGHLLALVGHLPDPVYAQVPFISPPQMRVVIDYIAAQYAHPEPVEV